MDKIDALVEWAKHYGAEISSDVTFKEFSPGNFGAFSDGSGPSSIKVPSDILIRLSNAAESFKVSQEALSKTSNINGILKLFLAREKSNSSSFFKPYLQALPDSAQINSPYVWLQADKQLLQGTNLGSSLRESIQQLVAEWWQVLEILPKDTELPERHHFNMKFFYESKFYDDQQLHQYLFSESAQNWTSFPAYLWASMVVKSRAFPSSVVPSGKDIDTCQEDVVVLVPVVDLLNHSPKADVTWKCSEGGFQLECTGSQSGQLFNNYGRKGNEELLLGYGFCIPDNSADSVALRIKIPLQLLPFIEEQVELPTLADYTTSVVVSEKVESPNATDGVLFFISKDHVPEQLVQVFQWLVKNPWDGDTLSLRMQLSGINHLRQALESKLAMIKPPSMVPETSPNASTIGTYLLGQRQILHNGISWIKRREAELLSEHKSQVLTLKAIYKKDVRFARSLLVTMGLTSYADIVAHEQMDQVWLLYLIRCYNLHEYIGDEELYLPEWVGQCFRRMDAETDIEAAEVVRFQSLYEGLILPMNHAVPEIYNRGRWSVRELIVSSRVMDCFGFVRGKNQEFILVKPEL